MRNNFNFLKRFKKGILFIVKKQNARIMTCGKCGSTNIIPISNSINKPFNNNNIKADSMYVQFSICKKCGAVCKEFQLWNYSGNIRELDSTVNIKNNF
jgi:ribosomal protein S27AE